MTVATDITIVGAGPFGLSIAAHLRGLGLDFRIIGSAMQSWLTRMPKGMLLKSEGFASSLYDPGRTLTLERFCKEQGIVYQDIGLPVPVETFSNYGVAFQKRLVPGLEDENLVAINLCAEGFDLRMESGKSFKTRKVVLAVGIDYFRNLPQALATLPSPLFSHSAEHHDLHGFRGQTVTVIGSGASAIDIAVLLHEAKAKVQLIVRKPTLTFGSEQAPSRPALLRIREPMSGLGPGWRNRLFADVPLLYRYLPEHIRLRTAKRFLGPSGGWFMKQRMAPVPLILGCELLESKVCASRVQLRLLAADGSNRLVTADHVIAATGYRPDVRRLPFLGSDILARLQLIGETPRLSRHFESSVAGLYFVGSIAATTFGPLTRFAVGAEFTSRQISGHLMKLSATGASSVAPKIKQIPGEN